MNDALEKAPVPKRVWHFRDCAEDVAEKLAENARINHILARLLTARGIHNVEDMESYLHPVLGCVHDPFLMRDMDKAVERLALAKKQKEKVAVFGDYDADGLTATALVTRFLKYIGIDVLPYVPDRINEGYGMSREGVQLLQGRGASLIVTVDNGISCLDETRFAGELGMDIIVTDHHQPSEALPEAVAVVDPHRADCDYPFKGLSGVGVAFKLIHALARHLELPVEEARAFLKAHLDLVALGTVADVMPLVDENRPLVAHGLKMLRQSHNPGLAAMVEMLVRDRDKALTGENIAFMFAPRLNAAGRTGNAADGLELLLTDSQVRAWEMAKHLDRLNQERRQFENEVLNSAMDLIEENPAYLEEPVLVIAGEQWHPGVVGIVASRLMERFNRPALVLGVDENDPTRARGSARSFEGFDIHEALHSCSHLLIEFGGHTLAAGVTLAVENVDSLRMEIGQYARKHTPPEALKARLEIDTIAHMDEVTLEVVEQMDAMRPFGQENAAPLVAFLNCEPLGNDGCQEVGSGAHLKMRLRQQTRNGSKPAPLSAIWFRYPQPRDAVRDIIKKSKHIDVAGVLRANEWNGRVSVELIIKDIRPSQEVPPE